jgi:hypothetical protein
MCYNHVHWAVYVEELERLSHQNYGILADQDSQYYDNHEMYVRLEMTRDELVKEWASYLVSNKNFNGTAYWITPLRDGKPLSEEEKSFLSGEASTLAVKLKNKRDAEDKKNAEEKQRKQEEENDKMSRAMYESLKNKYEGEI